MVDDPEKRAGISQPRYDVCPLPFNDGDSFAMGVISKHQQEVQHLIIMGLMKVVVGTAMTIYCVRALVLSFSLTRAATLQKKENQSKRRRV